MGQSHGIPFLLSNWSFMWTVVFELHGRQVSPSKIYISLINYNSLHLTRLLRFSMHTVLFFRYTLSIINTLSALFVITFKCTHSSFVSLLYYLYICHIICKHSCFLLFIYLKTNLLSEMICLRSYSLVTSYVISVIPEYVMHICVFIIGSASRKWSALASIIQE